jgi:hypothetical protein
VGADIQPVTIEGQPVRALLPATDNNGGVRLIPMAGQGSPVGNGGLPGRPTGASVPIMVPAFIMRYEQAGRVSELHVDPFELSAEVDDRWNQLLYCCLTPTAYDDIQIAYGLRLWRHPRWFDRMIFRNDRGRAEANVRAILKEIRKGDILWVRSVEAGVDKRV